MPEARRAGTRGPRRPCARAARCGAVPAFLLGLALLSAAPALAQADATDEFIRAQMESQNIPGLSLAVLVDGEIVKAAGYGVADIEGGTPATPETVYKIASVSKQFIASGVMLLVQDGRLALDDPIARYLEGTPEAWSGITIRHLLTHTAGLIREGPGFDPSSVRSDAEVIRSAHGRPLLFAPGEGAEYSNLGYFALAEIIRVASGRPWPEFLEARIFAPLGMRSTHPTNTGEPIAGRATGYTDNDRLIPGEEWPALRPSGAFLSTVLDLAKWDAALHADDILADSTRRAMWTPGTLEDGSRHPWGFGWQLGELRGHRLVHHTGGMNGFRSGFARFVDDGLSVIVLMNLDDVDIGSILLGVASLWLPPATSSPPPGSLAGRVSRRARPRPPPRGPGRTGAGGCRAPSRSP